ncbi:hypothetical protein, partial [Brevundimonas sp.]|uniref:hypothetical protein n=1 Tax=Brevundimonas sp. TaxID=1871086 RepID=UPI002AB9899C
AAEPSSDHRHQLLRPCGNGPGHKLGPDLKVGQVVETNINADPGNRVGVFAVGPGLDDRPHHRGREGAVDAKAKSCIDEGQVLRRFPFC